MKAVRTKGIFFRDIRLIDITYKTNLQFDGKLYLPSIEVDYGYDIEDSEEEESTKILSCFLEMHLFRKVRNPPFRMSIRLRAIFTASENPEYPLESFAKLQAPAYMVPYARELISNITGRGIFPTLHLPPLNVSRMMAEHDDEFTTSEK